MFVLICAYIFCTFIICANQLINIHNQCVKYLLMRYDFINLKYYEANNVLAIVFGRYIFFIALCKLYFYCNLAYKYFAALILCTFFALIFR